MKKARLTQKQKQAYEHFVNHKRIFNRYPTFKEAGAALNLAPMVVRSHIILAEKKGYKLDRFRKNRKTDQG